MFMRDDMWRGGSRQRSEQSCSAWRVGRETRRAVAAVRRVNEHTRTRSRGNDLDVWISPKKLLRVTAPSRQWCNEAGNDRNRWTLDSRARASIFSCTKAAEDTQCCTDYTRGRMLVYPKSPPTGDWGVIRYVDWLDSAPAGGTRAYGPGWTGRHVRYSRHFKKVSASFSIKKFCIIFC